MSADPLTHRELDYLLETHRKGAMLDGTDEHTDFVSAAIEYIPKLVAAVRPTIPGELLVSVFLRGLVPSTTLNSRGMWKAAHFPTAKEKQAVAVSLMRKKRPAFPVVVTVTRCAPRLLDDDNAAGACKKIRDAVADWFGVTDRDPRITWRVEQKKVTGKNAGTTIEIRKAVA